MKLFGLVLVTLVLLSGCSRSTGPVVYYVEGRVLLDGQPLDKAKVGFSSAEGSGPAAFGETDSSGAFRLTTARGGRPLGGAPAGTYIVTVRKYRDPLEKLGPRPDPSDVQGGAKWDAEATRLTAAPAESLIPVSYGETTTSPLQATVKKGRNTGPEFTFDLSSDFKSSAP